MEKTDIELELCFIFQQFRDVKGDLTPLSLALSLSLSFSLSLSLSEFAAPEEAGRRGKSGTPHMQPSGNTLFTQTE